MPRYSVVYVACFTVLVWNLTRLLSCKRALWCPPVTCDLCRFGSSSSVWPSSTSLSARCNSRNSRKPSDRKSKKSQFICHSLLSCVFVNWFPGSVIARSYDRLACLGVFYVSVCVAIPHFLIFLCFFRLSIICVMGVTNPGNEWLYIEAVVIYRSSANSVLSHVLFAAFTGKHFADDFYTIRPDDKFYLYSFPNFASN